MNAKLCFAFVGALVFGMMFVGVRGMGAGPLPVTGDYQLLDPIRHGNLTVFPVVSAKTHETSQFLTLDEGLRSGEVVVTEYGKVQGLVRGRGTRPGWNENTIPSRGAQVNTLVLVNNSKRPLVLLAGEIVTGGKQDRVIGKDRLVPAESDPVDLSVFCVEPGRWVGASDTFGATNTIPPMAAPNVRAKAMADKDQAKVWSEVGKSRESMAMVVTGAAPAINQSSSYARMMQNADVQKQVDSVAEPLRHDYESLIKRLRQQNAVGVVVAVNGEIVLADMFASTQLLEKYWPKLIRSYASEAVITRAKAATVSTKAAQEFLDQMQGRREMVESEPGVYRHTEITGDGFKAFELTSLLPKTGFDLHVAKIAQ
jgi:sulfur carrier protein ThiS